MSASLRTEQKQIDEQPLLVDSAALDDQQTDTTEAKVRAPRKEKSVKKTFFGTLKIMVAHLLAIALPIVVIVPALMNFSFFAWHPICMTVAYAFLMTEAIILFSPESSLVGQATRATKVNYHGYMLFCALLSALGGVTVIYTNKNAAGKPHFTSWHGLLGLITVVYTLVQVCAGIFLKYGAKVKLPAGLTLAQMKVYHSLSGCCLFMLGCGSLLLGLYSSWYTTKVHEYVWGGATIGGLLLMGVGVSHLAHVIKTKCKAPAQRKN